MTKEAISRALLRRAIDASKIKVDKATAISDKLNEDLHKSFSSLDADKIVNNTKDWLSSLDKEEKAKLQNISFRYGYDKRDAGIDGMGFTNEPSKGNFLEHLKKHKVGYGVGAGVVTATGLAYGLKKHFDKKKKMTKKATLQKIAISETTKFTGLGLAVGALPGASEFLRAQTIKDPEIRKRVRQNALKRLSLGLPIGGSIGYGTGKLIDTIHSGKQFFDNANKTFENTSKLDIDNINNSTKNISEILDKVRHPFKNLKEKFFKKK